MISKSEKESEKARRKDIEHKKERIKVRNKGIFRHQQQQQRQQQQAREGLTNTQSQTH
jgi:hypothetical protein